MKNVKKWVQKLLNRLGLHQRMKASFLYDVYWTIVDRRLIDARSNEVAFYRSVLCGFQPGDLIFDVGANLGHKVDVFLKLGASVLAVDPDEENQEILKQKFQKLRFKKKPVQFEETAVSDTTTTRTLWIEEPGSGLNTLTKKWVDTLRNDDQRFGERATYSTNREVQTTTLDQLISRYGKPFFIKIDVEGHEPNVIRGLKVPVPYVSFEVNLPEFTQEGLNCIRLLEEICPHGTFNFTTDCRALALDSWLGIEEFSQIFENCQESCVEVFWASKRE